MRSLITLEKKSRHGQWPGRPLYALRGYSCVAGRARTNCGKFRFKRHWSRRGCGVEQAPIVILSSSLADKNMRIQSSARNCP